MRVLQFLELLLSLILRLLQLLLEFVLFLVGFDLSLYHQLDFFVFGLDFYQRVIQLLDIFMELGLEITLAFRELRFQLLNLLQAFLGQQLSILELVLEFIELRLPVDVLVLEVFDFLQIPINSLLIFLILFILLLLQIFNDKCLLVQQLLEGDEFAFLFDQHFVHADRW